MILPLLLLASLASAAPAPSAAPAAAPRAKPYWLKLYSLTPQREAWTGTIEVKKLAEATPKIVAAVEKNGGRLTQPLDTFVADAGERQLVVLVPLKNAKDLLKAFRKLGTCADPAVRPVSPPIPAAEAREKLARLLKERTEESFSYAKVPAAAEAVDELIDHLSAVVAADRDGVPEVLWNITVRERR